MRKIEINYDFIEKIGESEGKFNLKRFVKKNPIYTSCYSITLIGVVVDAMSGVIPPEQAAEKISTLILSGIAFGFALNLVDRNRFHGLVYLSNEEAADAELMELLSLFSSIGINIRMKDFKESYVYNKNYKLRTDGKVGIIRERYIYVPTKNNFKDISIKEEHVIGSRQYVLSMDTPKKQVAYKPVFNV